MPKNISIHQLNFISQNSLKKRLNQNYFQNRDIYINNLASEYSQQWGTAPYICILYNVSDGRGREKIALSIPSMRTDSNYKSTEVDIEISLVSGNFNFSMDEISPSSFQSFFSTEFYNYNFELYHPIIVPKNPYINPTTEGSLWISTT